ncbi:hypothetical protein FOL46_000984 [Perkinsus olseni]|uniref:Uncharacterized protein n=1 Tax=Perkinsus olseni TaxID=32597 RepID=A0A7J6KTP9_PEROL|nr:hypothetical protein FOL46_000984 [Perkinsus olseni]
MELDALWVASTLLRDFITDIADYWGVTKLIICTDSEVNLARLRRSPTIIKTPDELVKQRRLVKIRNNVHELQQKTHVRVFFSHIDGELNPADPPSRGKLGNDDGLSQRLTYISQLVALLEDPGIYILENLPAFYVIPGDYEPIPIPSRITTQPTKITINNTITDDDRGDEITGYDTEDIATLLYHQRRFAQAFQEWQKSSLKMGRSHGPLNENLKMLRSTKPRLDWKTIVSEAVSLANGRPRWGTISSWDLLHTYPQDQS